MTAQIGRRGLVTSIGALAGAAALVGCTRDTGAAEDVAAADRSTPAEGTRSFHGPRQAGVDDVPQAFVTLVALDLAEGAERDTVRRLMAVWTDDIARLMAGRGPLTDLEPELAARPAELTVTVGWGPGAFAAAGVAPPTWLGPLPGFGIDALEARWSDGDLLLQVCAESPVTVAHAVRRLVTGASPMATQRWVQRGFRDPLMDAGKERMRNLFGQVDGTVNPSSGTAEDEKLIWDDGSTWRPHATGVVVRRIAMDLDGWDRADRRSREHSVGRRLSDGAPLTGGTELTAPDLEAVGDDGFPVIDTFSHLRRARLLAHLEGLDHVADLDVVEGPEVDAALEALADLGDVVLEPPQRRRSRGCRPRRRRRGPGGPWSCAISPSADQAAGDVAELAGRKTSRTSAVPS
jgi:dye decolorizing peroxidase